MEQMVSVEALKFFGHLSAFSCIVLLLYILVFVLIGWYDRWI